MNYKIKSIPRFEKDVKRLKKRFPKIKSDIKNLVEELKKTPNLGVHLSSGVYKIRLANSSVPTGKSGGFRVITYFFESETVYLLTIYSKSDEDTILTQRLIEIVKEEI